MACKKRINEIQPGAYWKLCKKVEMIWDIISMLSSDSMWADVDWVTNIIEEIEAWCGMHIGYKKLGVFSILEIANMCKNRAEDAVSIKALRKEFCYELELWAFTFCAYFGVDYGDICDDLKLPTSFDYNACMIYEGPEWISEERCYEESLKMAQAYRENYEQQMMDELNQFVEKKKITRRRRYSKFNDFSISVEKQRLNGDTKQYNDTIKNRILNADNFNEYQVDLDFLCSHQKAGCILASKYNRFAFFYDTGTGKTIMSLAIMYQKQREMHSSFLILAPLAIIENAWIEDARSYFPQMRIMPLCSSYKQKDYRELYDMWRTAGKIPEMFMISQYEWETFFRKKDFRNTVAYIKLLSMADHYIVNIEMYRRNPEDYMMKKVDGLIIDESALIKNPHTASARMIDDYSGEYKYIYLLSGKPAPNNSFEYYMQMRIVDPENFDMSPEAFKKTFFITGKDNLVFRNEEYETIAAEMIAQRSLIVSKEDCLKLEPQFEIEIPIELDPLTMKRYNNVMNGCFQKINEMDKHSKNRFVTTSRRLATVTKLREVTSGFIIDDDKNCRFIHDQKERALLKLITKYPNEQFVIWCSFVYEIERLTLLLNKYGKTVNAYGKTKSLTKSIADFKNRRAQYLIAHPKTLKYGVTLVNCQKAIYYSLSYSAEDYYQSHDRIYRMGQQKSCAFYFILAKNTIDETVYNCVKNKMNSADVFLQIVKHASEHGVNYVYDNEYKPSVNEQYIRMKSNVIRNAFSFNISGDCSFSYSYEDEERCSILFNSSIAEKSLLSPEEMLLEIGRDVLFGESLDINYRQLSMVTDWVISKMKQYDINLEERVYEFLEYQKEQQYEKDLARGMLTDDEIFIE